MDVKNAFLQSELNETVYMKPPPGYIGPNNPLTVHQGELAYIHYTFPHLVCKLNKALYGFKQAPRQWFTELSFSLKSQGFSQSKVDYSLFTKIEDQCFVAILVYVHDLILAGNSLALIQQTKAWLSSLFHMKDLGILSYFLGIEVHRSSQGLFLSQKKYVTDLLKEFNMTKCKPLKLSMAHTLKLTPSSGDPLPTPDIYQRLIGKLIYLTITRPDICYSIGILGQFMNQPTTSHLQAAFRILRYLSQSPYQGILFAAKSIAHLTAYCDSDWVGCPTIRKSTSGFCILLGDSPIS